MDLITLAELKAFLEIKTATTDHDALLSSLITGVSARIEKFLNRDLEKKARTKYFNAGRKNYYLPAYPIDLDSPITVVYDETLQVKDSDYYIWEDLGKIEFVLTTVCYRPKEIQITWTGGYASNSLPYDISLATTMQTAFIFRRRKDIGVSSISMPDGSLSVNVPVKLLPEVENMLKVHRASPGMR